MEKPNSSEINPDQLIMSADHSSDDHQLADHGSQSSSAVRSYECTFCKRGFSNAQALGGHMNIHRKDKAKLKQATFLIHETKQQQQSSEISKSHNDHQINYRVDDQDKDQFEPAGIDHDQVHSGESRKGLSSSAGRSSSESEMLDLELRLGPHEPPQDSSASATATRKFF